MPKRIAFIKVGDFSLVNEQIVNLLQLYYPENEIDIIDVLDLTMQHKGLMFINLFFMIKEFGLAVLLGKRAMQRGLFITTYLFKKIKQLVAEQIDPHRYLFTFQTQSFFDASVKSLPHFMYTDHTVLASLRHPSANKRTLNLQYPPQWVELEREIYHNATLNFSTSRFAADSMIEDYGCEPEKVACIYSGVNISIPTSAGLDVKDTGGKNILFVGIDWKRKGGPELIAAFKRVLPVHPDATLTIVGCSPAMDVPNCNVVGLVPKESVGAYYRAATMFCLPSQVEPSAVALVEAAAYQLPVVSTDVGGDSRSHHQW